MDGSGGRSLRRSSPGAPPPSSLAPFFPGATPLAAGSVPGCTASWLPPWCGPCRFIEPAFKELASHITNAIFVRIDVDELAVIAAGVAVGVALHAGAHLTCDFPRLLHASDAAYEAMKPFFGDKRPPNYWWFIKGTEGWTCVVMTWMYIAVPVLLYVNGRILWLFRSHDAVRI